MAGKGKALGANKVKGDNQDNDPLQGNDNDNLILGLGGDDLLLGLGGDDHLIGGRGDDTLRGGDDDDVLIGNHGNDSLEGGDGADRLKGGQGSDELYGGAGNDELKGGSGDDSLFGGDGDDVLQGGSGDDVLQGDGSSGDGNLITNGSFEDGFFTGWTAVSVDLVGGWDAHDGNNIVDLAAYANGSVSQSIATTAGTTYEVTFALSGNPYPTADQIKEMEITAGDESAQYSYDVTGHTYSDLGWVEHTFSFTADGASTLLTFASIDDTNDPVGPVIDNVRVYEAGGPSEGGDDVFVFADGHGNDTIVDFGNGDDRIDLADVSALNSFADVLAATSDAGGDAVIDTGDGSSITLAGVAEASLGADDFIFA